MADKKQERKKKRASWSVFISEDFEVLEALDRTYWKSVSMHDKLKVCIELSQEYARMRFKDTLPIARSKWRCQIVSFDDAQ